MIGDERPARAATSPQPAAAFAYPSPGLQISDPEGTQRRVYPGHLRKDVERPFGGGEVGRKRGSRRGSGLREAGYDPLRTLDNKDEPVHQILVQCNTKHATVHIFVMGLARLPG